jgi:uncharacterized Zn-binding protein involved in type VI secretion
MPTVGIHPPKTPVTTGSGGSARATLPNVCKMPGPPAPFVPSPQPNTATSDNSPENFSTTVVIEGDPVAIRGAMFASTGDMASKGTGGGLISANVHGPARFICPGSMTVKIEGKNVHLLTDPMLNNCAAGGTPPNTGATMNGLKQGDQKPADSPEAEVACAIHCCDKKEYSLRSSGKNEKTCQRLGCRKHSCVLHRLRKKKNGKLLQENKFIGVEASPRFPKGTVTGITRDLIPDTIINGDTIIDCKFPCDPAKVKARGFTKGNATKAFTGKQIGPSPRPLGAGDKEKKEYNNIDGIKDVRTMTPDQAEKVMGNCSCANT